MSDSYTKFSFAVVADNELELRWLFSAFQYLTALEDDEATTPNSYKRDKGTPLTLDDLAKIRMDFPGYDGIECRTEPYGDKHAFFVWSELNGAPGVAARIMQLWLSHHHPGKTVEFTWCEDSSSFRPDGFGGGSVLVTSHKSYFMSAGRGLEYLRLESGRAMESIPDTINCDD